MPSPQGYNAFVGDRIDLIRCIAYPPHLHGDMIGAIRLVAFHDGCDPVDGILQLILLKWSLATSDEKAFGGEEQSGLVASQLVRYGLSRRTRDDGYHIPSGGDLL